MTAEQRSTRRLVLAAGWLAVTSLVLGIAQIVGAVQHAPDPTPAVELAPVAGDPDTPAPLRTPTTPNPTKDPTNADHTR